MVGALFYGQAMDCQFLPVQKLPCRMFRCIFIFESECSVYELYGIEERVDICNRQVLFYEKKGENYV